MGKKYMCDGWTDGWTGWSFHAKWSLKIIRKYKCAANELIVIYKGEQAEGGCGRHHHASGADVKHATLAFGETRV